MAFVERVDGICLFLLFRVFLFHLLFTILIDNRLHKIYLKDVYFNIISKFNCLKTEFFVVNFNF